MAPAPVQTVTLLQQCRVCPSPAPAVTQPSALPLTFFDLVFWNIPPVQRLFFYDAAAVSVSDLLHSELPLLKQSLAATLHHFYPLAGKLSRNIEEGVTPEIVFSDGDFVRFTVAASSDDFDDLAGDHARETTRFHPLLPTLVQHKDVGLQDVLAIQVTVFPHAGISIGTTLHHAVADGSSYMHFMKTWATTHRLGATLPTPDEALPLFDRSVVRDADGLRKVFASDQRSFVDNKRLEAWDLSLRPGIVMETFRFTQSHLHKLQRYVEAETSARCSAYALACGAAWAGIVHARGSEGETANAHFGFVTGCKPRTNPPVPANYFGNCLGICRVEVKRSGLSGGDAVAAASAAIWEVIEGLAEEGRVFRDAKSWVQDVHAYASLRAVTVAGSPKLGVYGTEFGRPWGLPRKVEIVSVERTGALALAESGRDDDDGIEVGLALPGKEMDVFSAFYRDLLAVLQ